MPGRRERKSARHQIKRPHRAVVRGSEVTEDVGGRILGISLLKALPGFYDFRGMFAPIPLRERKEKIALPGGERFKGERSRSPGHERRIGAEVWRN